MAVTAHVGPNVGIFKHSLALTRCAGRNWVSDNASTTGASLAFFCAFSLAPLLVIVLTLVGWIVGTSAALAQIGFQLTALFGPATAKILLGAIQSSQQPAGTLGHLDQRGDPVDSGDNGIFRAADIARTDLEE